MSKKRNHAHTAAGKGQPGLAAVIIFILLLAVLAVSVYFHATATPAAPVGTEVPVGTATTQPSPAQPTPPTVKVTETPQPDLTPEPTPEPTPSPVPEFHPYHTAETDPANFVKNLGINVNGKTLGPDEVYEPPEQIDFLTGGDACERHPDHRGVGFAEDRQLQRLSDGAHALPPREK